MPRVGPISRRRLIRALRDLGFEGPFPGGVHEFMERGEQKVILPNPHEGDIDVHLLRRFLRDAGIGRAEWGSV